MIEPRVQESSRRASIVMLSHLLRRESHILLREPQLLPSHIYNILFLAKETKDSAAYLENRACGALTHRPWLRLLNRSGIPQSGTLAVLDHGVRVMAVAWSPDSRLLVSGGTSGTLQVWGWPSAKRLHELAESEATVTSLSWSAGGDLASGHSDGTIRMWETTTWCLKTTWHAPVVTEGQIRPIVAYSSLGILAVGVEEDVYLFAKGLFEVSRHHRFHMPISSLAWSPDGRKLAFASPGMHVGHKGPYVGHWNIVTGRINLILYGEPDAANAVAWLSDGKTIAASGINGTIFLWDELLGSGRGRLTRQKRGKGVLAASTCQGLLASSQEESLVSLWNPAEKHQRVIHHGHTQEVTCLAWSPDGRVIASGSFDETVRLWEPTFGSPGLDDEAEGPVGSVVWSPDGSKLACASPGGIMLLDQETGKVTASLRPEEDLGIATKLGWSAQGSHLVLADDYYGEDRLWLLDLTSRKWFRLDFVGPQFAWSPVRSILAVSGGDEIILIDAETRIRKLLGTCSGIMDVLRSGLYQLIRDPRILSGHVGNITAIAWSRSGSLLASGDENGTVVIQNPHQKRNIYARFIGGGEIIQSLAWSSEDRWLASASDRGIVRLWDVPGKSARRVIPTEAFLLSFSPVGHTLATAGVAGLRLWNAQSGDELTRPADASPTSLAALAWSPEGRLLITAGRDGTVRIHDSRDGHPIACAYCRSIVQALRFEDGAGTVKAADDGAATGDRVVTYIFQLCNI